MKLNTQWTQLLPTYLINNISTLGPVGFWGKAPGTNGSILGLIYYTLFFHALDAFGYTLFLLITIYLGIAFCGEAEIRMSKKDPKEVILDELVAIPVCFLGTFYLMEQASVWGVLLTGLILFRVFDILKPFGIAKLQGLKGGLGVVMDDVAAAVATNICLQVIFWAWNVQF